MVRGFLPGTCYCVSPSNGQRGGGGVNIEAQHLQLIAHQLRRKVGPKGAMRPWLTTPGAAAITIGMALTA